jgi:transposase-like protein
VSLVKNSAHVPQLLILSVRASGDGCLNRCLLKEELAMDYPIVDLMKEEACYEALMSQLHPNGLKCPRCQASEGLKIHQRRREAVVDYRCGACGRVFNIFTGTILQGTRRRPSELIMIERGMAQGQSTAQMARELKVNRPRLLELRHKLQANALAAIKPEKLKGPMVVEADEMYQNAGEKRGETHGPRRSAAAKGQPRQRARHLGKRPPAGAGRVRQRNR